MSDFQRFSRKGFAEARDLEPGEGLKELRAKGVSVSLADALEFDALPPGKVFRNAEDHNDFWYVARAFFEKNYNVEPMQKVPQPAEPERQARGACRSAAD